VMAVTFRESYANLVWPKEKAKDLKGLNHEKQF
jgi:hypothetical protein